MALLASSNVMTVFCFFECAAVGLPYHHVTCHHTRLLTLQA